MESILKRSSVGNTSGDAGPPEVRTFFWLQDFSELVPILNFSARPIELNRAPFEKHRGQTGLKKKW